MLLFSGDVQLPVANRDVRASIALSAMCPSTSLLGFFMHLIVALTLATSAVAAEIRMSSADVHGDHTDGLSVVIRDHDIISIRSEILADIDVVHIQLTKEGGAQNKAFSSTMIQKRFNFYINNVLVSSPTVVEPSIDSVVVTYEKDKIDLNSLLK